MCCLAKFWEFVKLFLLLKNGNEQKDMATRPIMLTCIMRSESGYLSPFWPEFLSMVSQLHRQHFLFKKYPTCYLCTNYIIVPITCNLKPACKSLGCYSFAICSGYSIFSFVFVFSLEKRSYITIIIFILYVGRNLVRKQTWNLSKSKREWKS